MTIALVVLCTILSIAVCALITPVLAILAMAVVSAMGGPNVPFIVRIILSAGMIGVGVLSYIGIPTIIFKLIL
jgi:hypothetical protein